MNCKVRSERKLQYQEHEKIAQTTQNLVVKKIHHYHH